MTGIRSSKRGQDGECYRRMSELCRLIWWALVGLLRSRAALEAENMVLHQVSFVKLS